MPKATTQSKNTKSAKKSHIYLLSDVNVAQGDGNADTPRQFSGVANSGKPFNHFGMPVIVDLADIDYHDKVPALIGHDRDKRAGFGVLSVENNQLIITGTLLNNDFGNEVADDADAGFPWQMSAHVIASSEETLSNGETATVNGQTVTAPITILRKCKIPEVSFTPTGVDDETSAIVLSDHLNDNANYDLAKHKQSQKDNTMTLDEALAKIKELETAEAEKAQRIKELEDENAKLKASETQANVDAQLSQAGFSKADNGESWNGLSASTYNMLLSATADNAKAMIGDLKLSHAGNVKPNAPAHLFSEEHKPASNSQNSQGGVKLSDNPLIANAQARGETSKGYV